MQGLAVALRGDGGGGRDAGGMSSAEPGLTRLIDKTVVHIAGGAWKTTQALKMEGKKQWMCLL